MAVLAALVAVPLSATMVSAQQESAPAASDDRPAGRTPAPSPALQDARQQAAQGAPQVQAAPGPRAVPVPDQYRLNMMVRSTILALNHANLTGNYTVLRDLGAPGFQVANNPARLAEIFAPMRARKLDLSPILFYNPRLVNEPSVQNGQFLRLTGFFGTQPEQVNFDLAFQAFAGQWMLAGIAVSTSPATAQTQGGPGPTSALPSPPGAQAARPASPAAAETGAAQPQGAEPKPVRIDLSQPAPLPARRPNVAPPRSAAASPAQAAPAAAQPARPAPAAAQAQSQGSGGSETETTEDGSRAWRPQ